MSMDASARGQQSERYSPAEQHGANGPARHFQKRVGEVRIAFGLIWVLNAWYKWQPGFGQGFAARFTKQIPTAPIVLRPWFQF